MPATNSTPAARNAPSADFTIIKVFPNGKELRFDQTKVHFLVALIKFFCWIYDPIVKSLPIRAPYKSRRGNFSADKHKILHFFSEFNVAFQNYGIGTRRQFVFPNACNNFLETGPLNFKNAMHILECAYSMAVPRPKLLNKGRGDSTYGETNLNQIASFVSQLNIGSKDVFVDLGSGIGQIVLFMSIFSKAKKSIGIELLSNLSKYAQENLKYFNKLLAHVGKRHNRVDLYQGNITEDRFHRIITQEATVIFINNFVLSERTMLSVRILLAACKDGMRIISSKPLYSLSRTGQTVRKTVQGGLGELENISTVEKLVSVEENVSWDHKKIDFWLTTISRK